MTQSNPFLFNTQDANIFDTDITTSIPKRGDNVSSQEGYGQHILERPAREMSPEPKIYLAHWWFTAFLCKHFLLGQYRLVLLCQLLAKQG